MREIFFNILNNYIKARNESYKHHMIANFLRTQSVKAIQKEADR